MDLTPWEMVARIALAGGLGFAVGLEREHHGRAAGLRTCVLVAMSGALLMILSLHLAALFGPAGSQSIIRLDPGRLASYAIAGMGFLGAGAIIKGRTSARGITTAAAMWASTGVGLAVGSGLYVPALAMTAGLLLVLWGLRRMARLIPHRQKVALLVRAASPSDYPAVKRFIEHHRAKLEFVGRQTFPDSDNIEFTFSLEILSGDKWGQFLDELAQVPGVLSYRWTEGEVS